VYDTLRYIRPQVATTCVGQAVAVGAVLLAAGAPGKRAALPHTRVVLHQPMGQGRGTIPDLILQADEVVRVRADIEDILSRHTGQDTATLRADTDRDRVFTAHAALDYGLIDHVIEERPLPGAASVACASAVGAAGATLDGVRGRLVATARARSPSVTSRAPATAAIISLDGSLTPRSISERYCGETPARRAVSTRISPRSLRSRRRHSPSASRHSGSRPSRGVSSAGMIRRTISAIRHIVSRSLPDVPAIPPTAESRGAGQVGPEAAAGTSGAADLAARLAAVQAQVGRVGEDELHVRGVPVDRVGLIAYEAGVPCWSCAPWRPTDAPPAARTACSTPLATNSAASMAGVVCLAVGEHIVHVRFGPGLEATDHVAQ
jgi:hypothetical protein